MTGQRLGVFIAGALTALAVVLGIWLAQQLTAAFEVTPVVGTPPPVIALRLTPTASPSVIAVPRGYRLAGVAVNADVLYAVIEMPDGSHALYRQQDEISGLGRLVHVGAERAVIATSNGDVTLWIAPAATPTLTSTARAATRTPRLSARPTPARGASTPATEP
jgi:hypothetical protein